MEKSTLTVDIQYDARRTDPEALACAMDRLMKTALSTPGILDEFGNPTVGEFFVAESAISDLQRYALRIDGDLLRNQRRLLLKLIDSAHRNVSDVPKAKDDMDLLEGILTLLDEIADQAHDQHGIDSLIEPEGEEDPGDHNRHRCECEMSGFFCSGVPGILAHMENGRLTEEPKVQRCDLCRRYDSDEAALDKLKELGLAPP